MTFGEKLHALRKQRGLSQEELACQVGVSRQSISKWELGEAMPDSENLIRISDVFGVTLDYLLRPDVSSDGEIPVVKKTKASARRNYSSLI